MIVGVDIGTQSLKVVVVDERLEVLGEASEPYAPSYPRPGWAEQDPLAWERALAPTIGRALAAAGGAPARVVALGIAGQLDGCVPTDGDGRALGPCLIWSDRRAVDEVADVPAAELRRAAGVTADASHMAAKIRWLGADSAARFHQPVSYLVARLTGEHVYDHGLASTTMLYELASRDYGERWLRCFGVRREQLPRIDRAEAVAGALHADGAALAGLPIGTPVAVGTGDDFSTPLGAGLVAPGRAVCVLGTAEVVGALSRELVVDERGLVETHAFPGGAHFVENPGWLAGGAVEWLRRIGRLDGVDELDRLAAAAGAGADGVLFVPALSGAMAPEWIADARGCFYGLTAAHDVGHLARAVLEGCAFAMRDVLDRVAELALAVDAILLLGGGARSQLWARIRADVMGASVQVPQTVDTSAIGAAMLAAVAAGVHADLASCAGLVGARLAVVEPDDTRRAVYDDAYAAYRRLFDGLRPMFGPTPGAA